MSRIYWSWRNISGSLKRIWQNITRGWNDSDCWSFDHTIAEFVIPRLKQLKKATHGHPACLCDDDNEDHDAGMQKWYNILDKMIYSFEIIAKDFDHLEIKDAGGKLEFVPIEDTKNSQPLTEDYWFKKESKYSTLEYIGTDEQKKLHDQYVKEYQQAMIAEHAKVQEGLDLFAKHYLSLWD